MRKLYFPLKKALIVAILPYFLEKSWKWYQKNEEKILRILNKKSFFSDNILFIEKNQFVKVSQILRKLELFGYERVQRVEELGEFSQKGGILEIFPINLSFPLKIEFLGNYIERILAQPKKSLKEKEQKIKERLKKKLKSQKLLSDLKNLKPGDFLVHLDHGIGKFLGMKRICLGQKENYYYLLEYAKGDKLYVPLNLKRKLSLYIAFKEPKISRLGSPFWQKTKRKIKKEAEKFAKELLELYAKREISKRAPYLPKSEIDFETESSFPFEETPDQIQVLKEIEKDFKKEKPMDRIVCGDSGFGKTEIALRTAVRAASSGYQVAILCPTTILANQHYQNFKERLKNLPLKIAQLSRIVSKREQKKIIREIKEGKIDIVIGTHRLLSKDVQFKNLQLLIIDEEQRFGVRQKEKFKKMRTFLDVLSLSATPIPRTLHLALCHLRDISLLQTPPPQRKPVKIFILPFSEKKVKKAIDFELQRKGQVYYLYNKIEKIGLIKKKLENLGKKDWKIAILHAKLKEKEIVKIMEDFRKKKINILLATTIIETGLDLPSVNTLIVADATRLGLAQAYQIRGRVGRGGVQGFAWFFYPEKLSEKAKLRLKILKEAQRPGAGYLIAKKDLEIRGAGNILGKEQSGNVNAVGLNLYCQMIAQAIEKLKE